MSVKITSVKTDPKLNRTTRCEGFILLNGQRLMVKSLQVALTLDRTKRAQEEAPVVVLNKPELDPETGKPENQTNRTHANQVKPANQRNP